jgi:hypothetical protein
MGFETELFNSQSIGTFRQLWEENWKSNLHPFPTSFPLP